MENQLTILSESLDKKLEVLPQTTKGLVYYKVRKNPKAPNRQLSGLEP